MPILNAKRLRDYPRLFLITTWLILGINLLLHQGWIGGFGQVIGGDFIMFYSTGQIYRTNPGLVYDYDTQTRTQQALVTPTILPGYNPFMNPPFAAPIYSLLTYIPLNWAMMVWTILAIASVFLSAYWLYKLYTIHKKPSAVPYIQLAIIVLSFFPFIEGLQAGQNHWITLLLVTAVLYSMFTEKGYLAGFLLGLLIYKPQFTLGIVILWLIWRNWRALLSFGLTALVWVGLFALTHGIDLYQYYLQLSGAFMELPYIPGFPKYIVVTFYGLLTSIFPQSSQPILSGLSFALFGVAALGLAWLAYQVRKSDSVERIPVIAAALMLPLLATPYALLHDLIILVPVYVLWTIYSNSQNVIYAAVIVYLGAFFLTFLGALTKFAWVSLLILGLFIVMIIWLVSNIKSTIKVIAIK